MVRVNSTTPALAALYPTRFSTPRKPLMDAVVMIRPPPCLTIWRAAAWQHRKTPVRLTRSTRCHWASACSRKGAECAIPALANITSSRPNSATTRSTKACTCPASPTSTRRAMALPPRSPISLATAWAASSSTSPRATRAPSAAKASPVARPMPSAPPVMAVTRPCKRIRLPSFRIRVSLRTQARSIQSKRRPVDAAADQHGVVAVDRGEPGQLRAARGQQGPLGGLAVHGHGHSWAEPPPRLSRRSLRRDLLHAERRHDPRVHRRGRPAPDRDHPGRRDAPRPRPYASLPPSPARHVGPRRRDQAWSRGRGIPALVLRELPCRAPSPDPERHGHRARSPRRHRSLRRQRGLPHLPKVPPPPK